MKNNIDAMYALYLLFIHADDNTMQQICNATDRNEDELAEIFSDMFEKEV